VPADANPQEPSEQIHEAQGRPLLIAGEVEQVPPLSPRSYWRRTTLISRFIPRFRRH
jgi:hypothetical protein